MAARYGDDGLERMVGLLLQRVEDMRGVYERFGACDLETGIRDALVQAKSVPLPESEYVDSHGEGIYTIHIIQGMRLYLLSSHAGSLASIS